MSIRAQKIILDPPKCPKKGDPCQILKTFQIRSAPDISKMYLGREEEMNWERIYLNVLQFGCFSPFTTVTMKDYSEASPNNEDI